MINEAAIDAIVPAHNEAGRVGQVVRALRAARCFRSVTVVDDGSTDSTAVEAKNAGARVLSLKPNRGKGGGMRSGITALPKDGSRIAFFDADLVGLRPEHAAQMVAASNRGYDMVCGLRDYSTMRNYAQLVAGPIITGERILRRWVLDRLPLSCWNGYRIEVAMNFTVTRHGGRTALLFLDGVRIVDKLQKTGFVSGLHGQLKMFAELGRTRDALRRTHGGSCAV